MGEENPGQTAWEGLSTEEALRLRSEFGLNSSEERSPSFWAIIGGELWSPVPWMLEAATVFEFTLGKKLEGSIILALLVFNAVLGFLQSNQAQKTLSTLKSRLAPNASVFRDRLWTILPSADLVPGDMIRLNLGAIVPADVTLLQGMLLLDVSLLTGESVPKETGNGESAFAGSLVRRGEALARVVTTGSRTRFGKTLNLVRTAHVESSEQKAILMVVRNLTLLNGSIVACLLVIASLHSLSPSEILPLVLSVLLGSIPVALPATFTLAASFGARSLAATGVLLTRLSSLDEAATMDTLCVDKTGTLTKNELSVYVVVPSEGTTVEEVLTCAAYASVEGGQDPVDLAIGRETGAHGLVPDRTSMIRFVPFDPETKTAQATVRSASGERVSIEKGALDQVSKKASMAADFLAVGRKWQEKGFRVLAVSKGRDQEMQVVGLIVLTDPPRDDSRKMVEELRSLGIRVVMVTGDAPMTALHLAHEVGISGALFPQSVIPEEVSFETWGIYAGVLPEDKFQLVKAFQKKNHVVGMCGDGANDAPALRQAQMGIAVFTATDVAKSAAGIVLTQPGLAGIIDTVNEGRKIFQRIQTYTLSSVIKKIVTVLFLGLGLLLTNHVVLTPMLMVLFLVTGDFLTMAITTDSVTGASRPNVWRVGQLTATAVILGVIFLIYALLMLAIGYRVFHLGIGEIRTFSFVAIVVGTQATLYAIRERRAFFRSPPGKWLLIASAMDLLIAGTLSHEGILMAPLSFLPLGMVLGGGLLYLLILDAVKRYVFQMFDIV